MIRDIKQISNTKNPIAAYALSLDRLEIVYGSHQTEIISPKDKEQFINLVTSKNPHIEIVKEWLHSHSFTLGLSYKVVHE